MASHFQAVRITNLILSNSTAWDYDNLKVSRKLLNPVSLRMTIEPYVHLGDKVIISAWHRAVYLAHGACVDFRGTDWKVTNSSHYAIAIFKNELATLRQAANQG